MADPIGVEEVIEADLRDRLGAHLLAATSLTFYAGLDADDAIEVCTWVAYDPHKPSWQHGTDALLDFEHHVAFGAAIGWGDDPPELRGLLGEGDG